MFDPTRPVTCVLAVDKNSDLAVCKFMVFFFGLRMDQSTALYVILSAGCSIEGFMGKSERC